MYMYILLHNKMSLHWPCIHSQESFITKNSCNCMKRCFMIFNSPAFTYSRNITVMKYMYIISWCHAQLYVKRRGKRARLLITNHSAASCSSPDPMAEQTQWLPFYKSANSISVTTRNQCLHVYGTIRKSFLTYVVNGVDISTYLYYSYQPIFIIVIKWSSTLQLHV